MALLAGTVVLAACGGGGGAAPAETAEPETAAEVPGHEIVFLGAFPEYLQEEIRYEANLVVEIFSERFGVAPPETVVTFAQTRQQLVDAYRELTGNVPSHPLRCFAQRLADGRYVIFINIGNCGFGYTVSEAAGFVLAHEFFHVVQLSLSPSLPGPYWLREGSAEYAMALFGDGARRMEYKAFRNSVLLRNASWTGTLREAGADGSHPPGHEHYFLGFLAAERLVELAGEEALLEYFSLLSSSPSWREAFQQAFGRTVDEFYEEFEPYRAEAIANYRTIRGRVLGADGRVRGGVTLLALDEFDLKGGYGASAPDGSFSIGLTKNGSYRVEIYVVDAGGLCHRAGWYMEGGALSSTAREATYVAVEGRQATVIDIELPAQPESRPAAGFCVQ